MESIHNKKQINTSEPLSYIACPYCSCTCHTAPAQCRSEHISACEAPRQPPSFPGDDRVDDHHAGGDHDDHDTPWRYVILLMLVMKFATSPNCNLEYRAVLQELWVGFAHYAMHGIMRIDALPHFAGVSSLISISISISTSFCWSLSSLISISSSPVPSSQLVSTRSGTQTCVEFFYDVAI